MGAKCPRGRTLFPAYPDGKRGNGVLFTDRLRAGVDSRKIQVLLEHRAARLVVNAAGEVIGLEATSLDNRTVTIRARDKVSGPSYMQKRMEYLDYAAAAPRPTPRSTARRCPGR